LRSKFQTRSIYSPPNIIDREGITTGNIQYGFWRQEEGFSGVEPLSHIKSNFYSAEAKKIRDGFIEYFNNEVQVCIHK
jgi:hypothetical protein